MLKRFLVLTAVIILAYVAIVSLQFNIFSRKQALHSSGREAMKTGDHTVSRFSFSKYMTSGERELEIEGHSANIFGHEVRLSNVIAKAYAEEVPVVITADQGTFDKSTSIVHLRENVVATTDTGRRLLTEELDLISGQQRLETSVQAEVKTENINVRGTNAMGDSRLKKLKFNKNVTVIMRNVNQPQARPTIINCDGSLEIDYKRAIATFHKNVVAEDERGELRADRMDVFYDEKTEELDRIVANGAVEIRKPDGSSTFSESVVYYARDGRMVLAGDPEATVYRGEDEDETLRDPLGIGEFDELGREDSSVAAGHVEDSESAGASENQNQPKLPDIISEGLP